MTSLSMLVAAGKSATVMLLSEGNTIFVNVKAIAGGNVVFVKANGKVGQMTVADFTVAWLGYAISSVNLKDANVPESVKFTQLNDQQLKQVKHTTSFVHHVNVEVKVEVRKKGFWERVGEGIRDGWKAFYGSTIGKIVTWITVIVVSVILTIVTFGAYAAAMLVVAAILAVVSMLINLIVQLAANWDSEGGGNFFHKLKKAAKKVNWVKVIEAGVTSMAGSGIGAVLGVVVSAVTTAVNAAVQIAANVVAGIATAVKVIKTIGTIIQLINVAIQIANTVLAIVTNNKAKKLQNLYEKFQNGTITEDEKNQMIKLAGQIENLQNASDVLGSISAICSIATSVLSLAGGTLNSASGTSTANYSLANSFNDMMTIGKSIDTLSGNKLGFNKAFGSQLNLNTGSVSGIGDSIANMSKSVISAIVGVLSIVGKIASISAEISSGILNGRYENYKKQVAENTGVSRKELDTFLEESSIFNLNTYLRKAMEANNGELTYEGYMKAVVGGCNQKQFGSATPAGTAFTMEKVGSIQSYMATHRYVQSTAMSIMGTVSSLIASSTALASAALNYVEPQNLNSKQKNGWEHGNGAALSNFVTFTSNTIGMLGALASNVGAIITLDAQIRYGIKIEKLTKLLNALDAKLAGTPEAQQSELQKRKESLTLQLNAASNAFSSMTATAANISSYTSLVTSVLNIVQLVTTFKTIQNEYENRMRDISSTFWKQMQDKKVAGTQLSVQDIDNLNTLLKKTKTGITADNLTVTIN
jgi:hypothetical protein